MQWSLIPSEMLLKPYIPTCSSAGTSSSHLNPLHLKTTATNKSRVTSVSSSSHHFASSEHLFLRVISRKSKFQTSDMREGVFASPPIVAVCVCVSQMKVLG